MGMWSLFDHFVTLWHEGQFPFLTSLWVNWNKTVLQIDLEWTKVTWIFFFKLHFVPSVTFVVFHTSPLLKDRRTILIAKEWCIMTGPPIIAWCTSKLHFPVPWISYYSMATKQKSIFFLPSPRNTWVAENCGAFVQIMIYNWDVYTHFNFSLSKHKFVIK